MTQIITVLASIKLAEGKTEQDLLAASETFEREFVRLQPGVLRRELVKKGAGEYIDIVQFRSAEDMEAIMELEMASPACHALFAVIDMTGMSNSGVATYSSLTTYSKA
jgi:hypothetical protein